MHRKPLLLAALLMPIAVLSLWVGYIQYHINHAPEIIIRAEGFDPRSLISGHYLSLRLNWQNTNCKQFGDNLCHPGRFESVYNYYLPEKEAMQIDKYIRTNRKLKIELVFAYPENKKPHLKRLLLGGKDWKDWLKAKEK